MFLSNDLLQGQNHKNNERNDVNTTSVMERVTNEQKQHTIVLRNDQYIDRISFPMVKTQQTTRYI